MKATPRTRSLQELVAAVSGPQKALLPNPEYQRGGGKWKLPQKQALIDSLLRGYHIPLLYIHVERRKNSLGDENVCRWIIDGQQRLNAIAAFHRGEFCLHKPKDGADEVYLGVDPPTWAGKHFKELDAADQQRLLEAQISTVEITEAAEGEVEDLFIRLQGGTPLTQQERRDVWPGKFSEFVIKHAGKPDHDKSEPSPFFNRLKKQGRKTAPDEEDEDAVYFDPLVEARRLFAQIAMTVMRREREGVNFVDCKGKSINAFYVQNLKISEDDPAARRVLRVLATAAALPGFNDMKLLSGNQLFHFAMLLDTLLVGQYVQDYRANYCAAFETFLAEVQLARHAYREHGQRSPLYDDFSVLLSGSGSDQGAKIGQRHAVFAEWMSRKLDIKLKDPKRLFDVLEREIVWWRDRRTCQNPTCRRLVPFPEATVHHVVEHTGGGQTTLANGVLVCTDCAPKRKELQAAGPALTNYLQSIPGGSVAEV